MFLREITNRCLLLIAAFGRLFFFFHLTNNLSLLSFFLVCQSWRAAKALVAMVLANRRSFSKQHLWVQGLSGELARREGTARGQFSACTVEEMNEMKGSTKVYIVN